MDKNTEHYFLPEEKKLLRSMQKAGIVRVGELTQLKDKSMSPIYVDMRDRLTDDHPELLPLVGKIFAHKIADITNQYKPGSNINHLGQVVIGVPDAAHPLAAATATMAALEGLPISLLVQRKSPKAHGTAGQKEKLVIGKPKPKREYNLIDDVITTSKSKRESIAIMENEGFKIKRVFVFFDRQQGGGESLLKDGYEFHAVFKLMEVGKFFLDEGLITSKQYDDVVEFIDTHQVE